MPRTYHGLGDAKLPKHHCAQNRPRFLIDTGKATFAMSTRNLRQADNAVSGRLALVTGSRFVMSLARKAACICQDLTTQAVGASVPPAHELWLQRDAMLCCTIRPVRYVFKCVAQKYPYSTDTDTGQSRDPGNRAQGQVPFATVYD